MKRSTAGDWIEHHLDRLDSVGLAPLIQQHVVMMLDEALKLCQSAQREDKESIHDLRVIFKRLRAYWRLVRSWVDKSEFERADRRIKLAGKLLSGQRDQQVLLDSLSLITTQLNSAERAAAEHLLQQWNHSLNKNRKALSIRWPNVISALRLERSAWQNLNCEPPENHPLQKGLHKTFRRQVEWSQQATYKQADPAQRHQWRKWVKYVYYQIHLLRHLGLKGQKKIVKRFDKLGELLGMEHDLGVLQDFLEQRFSQSENQQEIANLISAIHYFKKGLYKQINRLSKAINKAT